MNHQKFKKSILKDVDVINLDAKKSIVNAFKQEFHVRNNANV